MKNELIDRVPIGACSEHLYPIAIWRLLLGGLDSGLENQRGFLKCTITQKYIYLSWAFLT